MKASRKILFGSALIPVLFSGLIYSQASTSNNFLGAPNYLGWNSASFNNNLIIQNEDPRPINFLLGGTPRFNIEATGRFAIPTASATFPTDFLSISTGDNFVRMINIDLGITPVQNTKVGLGVEILNSGNTQRGIIGLTQGFQTTNPVVNYGVYAFATGQTGSAFTRGVWGKVDPGCNNGTELAALFDGDVFTTVIPMGPSDINLKENIEAVTGSDLTKLQSLEPKTYNYDSSIEVMNLPTVLQYGLIAQNVDTLFPSFTRTIDHPSDWDPNDNSIVNESISYLGLSYSQFISLLVAGYQEQNDLIQNQISEISELEADLVQLESAVLTKSISKKLEKSQIVSKFNVFPNPVDNILNAEVNFDEEYYGSIVLYDLNFKKIETLKQRTLIDGEQFFQFDLSHLASGYYFIALQTEDENFVLKLKR